MEATEGKGVDVILDMVGGDYIPKNLKCLAVEGRLVQIAFLQGQQGGDQSAAAHDEAADAHRLDACGRARSRRKREIAQSLREKVWPLLESGKIAPVIYKTFPAGASRRGAPPDGKQRACGQDRAGDGEGVAVRAALSRAS